MDHQTDTFAAFAGVELLAHGPLAIVAAAARQKAQQGGCDRVVVYRDETGRVVEMDFSKPLEEILAAVEPCDAPPTDSGEGDAQKSPGPGRPKLGVVAREVTLLPAHWDWLASQSGGASAVLRRLVVKAMRENRQADQERAVREAAHRFLWDMAGNLPGFEEASRQFYRNDVEQMRQIMGSWPAGVRTYAEQFLTRLEAVKQI